MRGSRCGNVCVGGDGVRGGAGGENSRLARRAAAGVGVAAWWWPAELRHYCR
jgi:hypothetical protein